MLCQPKLYRTTKGLAVETTPTPSAYQLAANARRLDAGRYAVVVRASVIRGGIQLGVLDCDANAWLSTRLFWSGQSQVAGADLVVPFSLGRATRSPGHSRRTGYATPGGRCGSSSKSGWVVALRSRPLTGLIARTSRNGCAS